MSPYQIIAVAARLFAIWLVFFVLKNVPTLYLAKESTGVWFLYSLVLVIFAGVLALVLWVFPRTIAGNLLSPQAEESPPSASPDIWLAMGCTLLGLWILISNLPRLVFELFSLSSFGSGFEDTKVRTFWLLDHTFEIAVAVWLIFGARGFRHFFWRTYGDRTS